MSHDPRRVLSTGEARAFYGACVHQVFTAPAGCELRTRGMRVVEREGWYQTIAPGSKSGSGNEVVYSVVAEADADRILDATIAEYRAAGVPFKWCIGPPT